jgi:hypothetical protein
MLSTVTRRSVVVASKKLFFKSLSSRAPTKRAAADPPTIVLPVQDGERVPKEAYDSENHLLTGHLEYLDKMLEKTAMMEESMDELKETYDKKKEIMASRPQMVGWMEADDIDFLLERAAQQKEDISSSIAELKVLIEGAKKTYAVDGPDGESDWHMKEELEEVAHIIEDSTKIKLVPPEDMYYAVDAPDGEVDGHFQEEIGEVNRLIDDAAEMERGEARERILRRHRADAAIRKDHARDPEHDW